MGVDTGDLLCGMLNLRRPLDIQGKMPNGQLSRQY